MMVRTMAKSSNMPKKPKTKASLLKGVYNMNPTKMVMKSGGILQRVGVTENVPGFKKVKPAGPRKPITKKGNKK